MPTRLTESRPLVLTEALDAQTGLFEVQLISPGVGSSGAYPEATLTEAVKNGVWGKGLHLYLDHPTASEAVERPERSVRDLAGVLVENARWNGSAVVAKAKVYSAFRPLLAEAAEDIGMSIRAAGTAEFGEYDGQRMTVITSLDEAYSVDFVTHAGRGGAVLSVLESARVAAQEASTETTRELLSAAVKAAHGGQAKYIWVRDFDPDRLVVWFHISAEGDLDQTLEQGYSFDGSVLDLTGQAREVRQVTTYVPVTPAGQSTITTESEEDTMPQIEEARLRQLEADAGRVQTLESERDAAATRAEAAERLLDESTARTAARPIIATVLAEATTPLPPATVTRLTEGLVARTPLTADGALDETALRAATEAARTAAETEVAAIAEALGVGKPTGLGGSGQPAGDGISESEFAQALGLTTTTGV